jgi:hypothetical protein
MLIEKRYYTRLAFSFTEPSFISMHLFGILYLVSLFIKNKQYKTKLYVIIAMFSALTIISGSSGRFFIDFAIICALVSLKQMASLKIKIKGKILICIAIISLAPILINVTMSNDRIKKIFMETNSVEDILYRDSSLASRYFRINASIHGYEKNPVEALIGKGLGNSYYFFQEGYYDALSEYKNEFIDEIITLSNEKIKQLFSMPIRIISEIGLVAFLLIVFILILLSLKYRSIFDLMIVLYLYLQFDSYAFYTIYIYLIYLKINSLALENRKYDSTSIKSNVLLFSSQNFGK